LEDKRSAETVKPLHSSKGGNATSEQPQKQRQKARPPSSIFSQLHFLYIFYLTFILLGKSVENKFLFTMTAYTGQTRTTLGQLCTALGAVM
jgi:hypothetical protein